MSDFLVNWLAMVPAFAAPYALGALGLLITERAGVLCLAVEGFMLIGAVVGIGAALTLGGYPYVPLLAGGLAAMAASLVFAALVLLLRVEQVIAGLAMVFLLLGLSSLLGSLFGWTSVAISGTAGLAIPALRDLPYVGRILFEQDVVIYLTPLLFGLAWLYFGHSMGGLRHKAVGDSPEAADSGGVGVAVIRLRAILTGAFLMGVAGAYLSVIVAKIWVDGMVGGRGFIVIALVIFSGWRPFRALGAALIFGSIEALIPRIAASGIAAPQYLLLMAPYLGTLAVMIWSAASGKGRDLTPRALGRAYVREERH